MGKSIQLPPIPTFQANKWAGLSEEALYNKGQQLTSGNINDLPAWLQDTVNTSPESGKLYLEGLKASLAPSLRKSQQDVISQLEANNQLTGSTTGSSLGNLESDYLSGLTKATTDFGIADINRAMANRVDLYKTGLNSIDRSGTMGLTDQSQVNNFNLENYQNEVARTLAGQKPSTGGWMGALTGGLGGAAAGFALAPFTGGASLTAMLPTILGGLGGAAAGGFGPSGTGGSLLSAGASMAGSARLASPVTNVPSAGVGSINGNNEQIQDILRGSPSSGTNYLSGNMSKYYNGGL